MPLRTMSNRITARTASTMSSIAPDATASASSAKKFRRVRRAARRASAARSGTPPAATRHAVAPRRRFIRRIAQSPTVLMPKVAMNSSVPRKNSTV